MRAGYVEDGALARCQFGTASAPIRTTNHTTVATASDFVPFENIQPFGVCSCPGNPQVTAARGAATPMPCVPAVSEPWQVAESRMWVRGVRALDPQSWARCRWGGLIQLTHPGRR
jgi:hypothetical protein